MDTIEYLYVATVQYVWNDPKEWVAFCDDKETAMRLCDEHRLAVHSTENPLDWENVNQHLFTATSVGECQYQVSRVVKNTRNLRGVKID